MDEAVAETKAFATIGDELRWARESVNATAQDCARWAGISPQYFSDIEHNRRVPPPDTIERIAASIGYDPVPWLWRWVVQQMGLERAGELREWLRREIPHES